MAADDIIRVLCIDDNPHDRDLIRHALEVEDGGFAVTTAEDRASFERALSPGAFDVVLTDFNILGFEGVDVIDRVREKASGVPVVVVTGTGSEEVAVRSLRHGAADYVIKTHQHLARLPATIRSVIEKTELDRTLERTREQHKRLIDSSPDGILVVDGEGKILFGNQAAGALFGRERDRLVGTPFGHALSGEGVTEVEIPGPGGSVTIAEMIPSPTVWDDRKAFLLNFRDVTRRFEDREKIEHLNSLLMAIRDVNQLIVTEKDPARLVRKACAILIETRGYHGVWIVAEDPGGAVLQGTEGFGEAFEEMAGSLHGGERPPCWEGMAGSGHWGTAVRDPRRACKTCPLWRAYGHNLALTSPLRYGGTLFGVLGVAAPPRIAHLDDEESLLAEVASDIGLALHTIELERRNVQFARIVASSGEAMALVDHDFAYLVANDAYGTIVGRDAADLRGQSLEDVLGGDFFQTVVRPNLEQALCGERLRHEAEHVGPDGGRRFLQADYSPCFGEAGRVESAAVCIRDVTELRSAERRAVQERDHAQQYLEIAGTILLVIDGRGIVIEINRKGCEVLGYPREEIVGCNWLEKFIPPEDRCDVQAISERLLAGDARQYRHHEGMVLTKGGRKRLIAWVNTLIQDEEGRITGHLSSGEDITERHLRYVLDGARMDILSSAIELDTAGTLEILLDKAAKLTGSRYALLVESGAQREVGTLRSTEGAPAPEEIPALARCIESGRTEKGRDGTGCPVLCVPVLRAGDAVSALILGGAGKPYGEADEPIAGFFSDLAWELFQRKLAEEAFRETHSALEEQKQFLEALLDALPVPVFTKDTDLRYTGCNRAFAEMLGVTEEEIRGKTVEELWPSGLAAEYSEKDLELLRTLNRQEYESRVKARTGELYDVIFVKNALKNDRGEAVGIVGAYIDTTDFKRAQRELQKTTERLNSAAEAGNIGFWDWNLEADEAHFSPEWKRQIGYEPDELEDRYETWESRLHPDDRDAVLTRLKAYLDQQEESFDVIFRLRHRNGGYRWVHARGAVDRENGGNAGHMLGTHVDITDLKEAEEDLIRQERFLRVAIEQMPVPTIIARAPDVEISHYNDPARALLVKEAADLREIPLGAHREYWPTFEPDGEPIAVEDLPLTSAIRDGRETRNREILVRMEDGDRWISASAAPLRNEAGGIEAGIVVFPDITERKRQEERIRALEAQFQQAQKLESIGRLAGGMAHDFNNMLNVIMGHADLALEGTEEDNPLRNDLKGILTAAKRSRDLIRQLLAFARRQPIQPERLHWGRILEESGAMIRRLLGEEISLEIHADADLWPIRADLSQMQQLLMNLAANARDAVEGVGLVAMRAENVSMVVEEDTEIEGERTGEFVRLTFSDSGAGMDEEALNRLFEPFFTTKGEGKGTGLGLAQVYGVIQQNGGFIRVRSRLGEGTAFECFFPRDPGEAPPEEENEPAAPTAGCERVLIVEDEPQVLDLCRRFLEREGYRVVAVSSPGEALRLVREGAERFDLLLSDVIMPEMNGMELREEIRRLQPGMRVLFMSGYTSGIIGDRGVLREGIVFLMKPFTGKALAERVRGVLDAEGDGPAPNPPAGRV